jgi:hypothetical protein
MEMAGYKKCYTYEYNRRLLMKIAICFSGQMRTAIYAFHNIKHFLGDLINSSDFFIHTWDNNSEKSVWGDKFRRRLEFSIPQADLEAYINLYSPKKYEIGELPPDRESKTPEYSKMRSLIRCMQLKQEYERSNGFIYDVVIKLRPDMIVDPAISMYSVLNHLTFADNILFVNEIVYDRPDDVIWFAKSSTMDIISEYPLAHHTLGGRAWIVFSEYLALRNIKSRRFDGESRYHFRVISDKWSILRTEAIRYHPVDEYKKCLEIDRNMYWNPDPSVAPFEKYLTVAEWSTILKNMFQIKGVIPPHLEHLL